MGKKQVVSKYKNIVGWVSWKSSDIYIYRDALSLLWLSPEVSADTTIEKKKIMANHSNATKNNSSAMSY